VVGVKEGGGAVGHMAAPPVTHGIVPVASATGRQWVVGRAEGVIDAEGGGGGAVAGGGDGPCSNTWQLLCGVARNRYTLGRSFIILSSSESRLHCCSSSKASQTLPKFTREACVVRMLHFF
jgi:hypothetical protein